MADMNHLADMKDKIADILKEHPHIPGLGSFTSKPDEVTVEHDPLFHEGATNVLARLRAGDGSTAIAKYAPPYIRTLGENMLMPQIRTELEETALRLFEQYSPGSGPKAFFYSSKHNTILMEDLVGYKMLHSELVAGNISKVAIGNLAVHMASIHRSTHKDNISAQEWEKLQELVRDKYQPLAANLIQAFKSYPYIMDPQDDVARELRKMADSKIFGNSKMHEYLIQFIEDYAFREECLIHGDTHARDLLVKGDEVKLIDPEYAHLGQCSDDVGMLFADLVEAYYYHLVVGRDRQVAHTMKEYSYHLVNTYIEHMVWGSGEKTPHVAKFLKDLAASIGPMLFTHMCFGLRAFLGTNQIGLIEAAIRLMEQHQEVDSVDKIYSALALDEI